MDTECRITFKLMLTFKFVYHLEWVVSVTSVISALPLVGNCHLYFAYFLFIFFCFVTYLFNLGMRNYWLMHRAL